MSGSPKHCAWQLAQERERQLQAERQRQAAVEAARRRAEEERQRQERVAQMQGEARQQAAAHDARLARFQKSPASAFVKEQVQKLAKRLQQLPGEISQCQDEARLKQLQQELTALNDALAQVSAEGEAAQEAAHLAREEAALATLKRMFGAQDPQRARKFDAEGALQIQQLITQAESALQNKQTQKGEDLVAQANTLLQKHKSDVQQRFSAWTEKRWQASAAIAKSNDGLTGLRADRTVARWQAAEVKALEERSRRASGLVESEQFDAAQTEAQAVLKEAEAVVARAQEAQLNEERRAYIVQGIVNVMSNLGFMIQSGTPRLETAADPASATIIHARQLTGEGVVVSVPQKGEVWYDVQEYDMEKTPQLNGKTIATCDKAEEQILGFHKMLLDKFGIQMGELQWDDKDPDRVSKKAEMYANQKQAPRGAKHG